jgi:hypothetical protein
MPSCRIGGTLISTENSGYFELCKTDFRFCLRNSERDPTRVILLKSDVPVSIRCPMQMFQKLPDLLMRYCVCTVAIHTPQNKK